MGSSFYLNCYSIWRIDHHATTTLASTELKKRYLSFQFGQIWLSFSMMRTKIGSFFVDHICHISFSVVSRLLLIKLEKNPVAITQHQLLHCIYLENCTLWWRFFRKFRCIYPMTLHTKIDICLNSTKNDQIFVIGPQCPSSPSFARCCKSAKNVIICSDGFWDNSIIVLLGKIKTTMFSCWFYTVGERLLASKR